MTMSTLSLWSAWAMFIAFLALPYSLRDIDLRLSSSPNSASGAVSVAIAICQPTQPQSKFRTSRDDK